MIYLVAYDIAEPKRLRRVCSLLEGFGTRVQYSVFECNISTPTMMGLWELLMRRINPEEDRLSAYPIDQSNLDRTLRAGAFSGPPVGENLLLIM